jgi:hypothetical protein
MKSSKFLPHDVIERAYRLLPLVKEASGPKYQRTLADGKTSEQLLQALWAAQHFDKSRPLRLTNGTLLTVKYPGQWNQEHGPDFLRAKCLFAENAVVTGDIEVHATASDWYKHRHHQDPRYNSVILHVVYRNDLDTPCLSRADGSLLPQLELCTYLLEDLSTWIDSAAPPSSLTPVRSPCYEALGQIPPEKMVLFLDLMGDMRFAEKGERFRQRIAECGVEQALYEGIMGALGYKTNRFSFWILAKRLPLQKLLAMRHALSIPHPSLFFQGLFLGAGNLLATAAPAGDQETTAYLEAVQHYWELGKRAYGIVEEPLSWNFAGIRPANTPFRRLAAMSHFLPRLHTTALTALVQQKVQQTWDELHRGTTTGRVFWHLYEILGQEEDPYWSYRYTLGGKKLATPHKLLGEERARTLVVDVLFPCLFAWARVEQDFTLAEQVYHLYTVHPRLGANTVLHYMEEQLFTGTGAHQHHLITTARRQQALLHLYHHFCWEEAPSCTECALLTVIRELY